MPIRFRCAYCNQLMGIARRKAGMVVICPTCAGQVVVPNPESVPEEPPSEEVPQAPQPANGPGLFERSDFEQEIFNPQPQPAARSSDRGFKPVPQPDHGPAPRGFDVEPVNATSGTNYSAPPPPPPGIFLTPSKVTILAVFVVLLIGVAFFAGMLVGRS